MEARCPQCGRTYKPRRKGQKYCSPTCLTDSQRAPKKACAQCGELFQPRKGTAQKYCGPSCERAARATPKPCTCVGCGQTFLSAKVAQKFCTPACRRAVWQAEQRAKKAALAETTPKLPKQRAKPAWRGLQERPCDYCHAAYAPSHGYQQFCSVACKDAAHTERMRGRRNPNFQHGLETGVHSKQFKRELSPALRQSACCAECGASEPLVTHHMDENKQNNEPWNLVVLCNSCHIRFHKLRDADARLSMILRWTRITAS